MARRCGDRHCLWCSRYCVWCSREMKGSLEVFLGGRWVPVCTVCYRARCNRIARTLAEIEVGERYAFRLSNCGLRVRKDEPPAPPPQPKIGPQEVAFLKTLPRAIKRLWNSLPNGGRVM
jgi:hypothetical protein